MKTSKTKINPMKRVYEIVEIEPPQPIMS